jgi:hypothetical protein
MMHSLSTLVLTLLGGIVFVLVMGFVLVRSGKKYGH